MVEYKLKDGNFLEDGHTVFKEDVLTRLKRLDFLEKLAKKLPKVIDKHFWDYENHHYECDDSFLADLDKLHRGEFSVSEVSD